MALAGGETLNKNQEGKALSKWMNDSRESVRGNDTSDLSYPIQVRDTRFSDTALGQAYLVSAVCTAGGDDNRSGEAGYDDVDDVEDGAVKGAAIDANGLLHGLREGTSVD